MQQKIKKLMGEGVLLSPDVLEEEIEVEDILNKTKGNKPVVLDSLLLKNINGETISKIKWRSYDSEKVFAEKTGKQAQTKTYYDMKSKTSKRTSQITFLETFEDINSKITMGDFVNMYNRRYLALQQILSQRQELQGARTIRKINQADNNERVSFIGAIMDKRTTKNNHIMLKMEDQTGLTKAIVTTRNKEAHEVAKDLTPDEVIGVNGAKGNRIVFVNNIITPDVPITKELKKSPKKEAALFISDLHIGAKAFLKKDFEKFISWIRGEIGSEKQKKSVEKIKYLFIVGDLVEGIGIYPGHESDLEIKDVYEQFKLFCDYMKQIPERIEIIICPGNHDPVRIAEPQPPLTKDLIGELIDKENIHFVSSPSRVRISETKDFTGLDVLLYHGYSFPYYANNIESIRLKGGLKRTENIMQYLLKKRHLAPTHGSTRYQLGYEEDPLLIKHVPDLFVTGHIHRTSVETYRNVTLLNCSCWISQTDYQEKRGLVPQPSRAIYVDLNTRKTKVLNFKEK